MRNMTEADWRFVYDELAQPFDPSEVGWKPQAFNKTDKSKALLVAFVDARVVSDRLNNVVGPGNWNTEYTVIPSFGSDNQGNPLFGVSCKLTVFGTTREDVGTPSMSDGLKGCFSDALKRAAVHFGVGRYLYELEPVWGQLDSYKKVVNTPDLPDWALPGESNPDAIIFNLLNDVLSSNPSAEVRQSALEIVSKFHPNLSKLEKRDIYKALKGLTN